MVSDAMVSDAMVSEMHAAHIEQSSQAKPAEAAGEPRPVNISCTRGLADWLLRNNVSLAFTSYQTGRLHLVGVDDQKRVAFQERFLARAMGLWADQQRMLVAAIFQVWRFENVLPVPGTGNGPDRHYVPRVAHTTGDLDIHEMSVMGDGRIVIVNTLFSCLATLSPTHSFRVLWKPPFISKLAAEDRCHLNGLAMRDGAPAYVTATSRSDVAGGWRDRRAEGGCVIDVASNAIITDKLSMPHSPRWVDGRLYSSRARFVQASCAGSPSTTVMPSLGCRCRAMAHSAGSRWIRSSRGATPIPGVACKS
jgi:uncharacterized protein (TIGR03032 family)